MSDIQLSHPTESSLTVHQEGKTLLIDKKNTKYATIGGIISRILLPVKKRKVENVKKQRSKNHGVSQKQCKLSFPPCKVCLGKGTGLHYGVNSCESCKSFFRRCLTRKEEYKCSKGKNCPVTSQVRGNCSGCRYLRCLEVGMSREAACLGRYTLSRRTKTIMEAKGEEGAPDIDVSKKASNRIRKDGLSASSPYSCIDTIKVAADGSEADTCSPIQDQLLTETKYMPLKTSAIIEVTIEEGKQASWKYIKDDHPQMYIDLVEQLVSAMKEIRPFGSIVTEEEIKAKLQEDYESYMTKAEVFGKMKPVPQDEYVTLLETTGIDIDGRQEFLRQSAMSCQPVLHSYIAFANVVPGFSSLSLEDQCSLLKTSHFEVFLFLTYKGYDSDLQMILTETGKAYHIDQAADIFYSRNLINSIFDVCKKIQALCLSKEETALLLAIAVTFGDRCNLEDSISVEEIQMQVVSIFRWYLSVSRPHNASKFFTKLWTASLQ
ncbi:probable nuclear hormone receptor HR3 [Dreissena polymorpha]|uniref:Nuclear receptor domain-containing protein n=1 Tax=Dreissena polymorpha TaxID=45954 RepID=A0A9D4N4H9_DREPO|nr:probable nuclear hormone receptor HR3 [Dreissena polymorpha]KAH3886587.1 hypothetical protein DPMN_010598 [Dreissena polymorpha]